MNNFADYITIDKAVEFAMKNGDKRRPSIIRAEYERQAADTSSCCNCDEEVWRYAGNGMCFSCTTGESDASEDYELVPMGAVAEKLRIELALLEAVKPPKAPRVPCPICNKRVAKSGLSAHHKAKHSTQQEPKGKEA